LQKFSKSLPVLVLAAVAAWATAASEEPAIRIGVVDIDQAISSTEEGKAAREELSRKQREAETKVQPMIERYRALEEELKTKKFVLSDDALYQKQLDLAEMRNEVQAKMREIDGQLQVDQKRLEGPLLAKLKDIIEEIGKSQGFTLIIHRNAPGVLYARESVDITSQVVERYNKKKG
jgi:outer membrane protein